MTDIKRNLFLPYSNLNESGQGVSYLNTRLSRMLQDYRFMQLELEPGVLAYIDDEYKLVNESEGNDQLGISWNADGYVELSKLESSGQIYPVYLSDKGSLDKSYNNLWNTIESRLESKYGTREYELYFSFERMQFILLPRLDLITNEARLELFKRIWEVNADVIDYFLEVPENFKLTQTTQTYNMVYNQGYTPLWVDTHEADRFKLEKSLLLDQMLDKIDIDNKLKGVEKKAASLIKSELTTKSEILRESNYRIVMMNKSEDLNKDFVKWVLVRDIVVDSIV